MKRTSINEYCEYEFLIDYGTHVFFAQIVRQDRTLEQIVFQIPEICEYLTEETKNKVFNSTERDEQGSKVSDFFQVQLSQF